ncbi:hypothetical protein Bbelb_137850 [Branchiostoma belcheri]|nr:hypothetical protein Bbelb_137850 [Branchiostoma belcheri]
MATRSPPSGLALTRCDPECPQRITTWATSPTGPTAPDPLTKYDSSPAVLTALRRPRPWPCVRPTGLHDASVGTKPKPEITTSLRDRLFSIQFKSSSSGSGNTISTSECDVFPRQYLSTRGDDHPLSDEYERWFCAEISARVPVGQKVGKQPVAMSQKLSLLPDAGISWDRSLTGIPCGRLATERSSDRNLAWEPFQDFELPSNICLEVRFSHVRGLLTLCRPARLLLQRPGMTIMCTYRSAERARRPDKSVPSISKASVILSAARQAFFPIQYNGDRSLGSGPPPRLALRY